MCISRKLLAEHDCCNEQTKGRAQMKQREIVLSEGHWRINS